MTKPFKERCAAEATRDAIFLLQSRFLNLIEEPYGWELDEEGQLVMMEEDADCANEREVTLFLLAGQHDEKPTLSIQELYERSRDYCVVEWRTESVWLSREEATEWATGHTYRFAEGWRVYAVCAEGELAQLIRGT